MSNHSQILVVSHDQMLLQTRRLILGTYFEVEGAGRMSEAGSILSKHDFDLIVLCDTLSDNERAQIAELISDQDPQPKLLSLLGPGTRGHDPVVGRKIPAGAGPLGLLKACADTLGYDLSVKRNNPN